MIGWIAFQTDTPRKPEVKRICNALALHPAHAIGLLCLFWCWIDEQSADGTIDGLGLSDIDDIVQQPGFGAALASVGWLEETPNGLQIPNFERHHSQSSKRRMQTAARVRRHRESCNAESVTKALPHNRTEENRTEPKKPHHEPAAQAQSDHQPPTAADRVNGHAIPHDPAAVTQSHLHAIRSDIRDQFDRLPENRRTKRARFEKSMAAAQARSGRSFAAIGDALLAYYASPVGQTRWARDATRFLDDDGFEEPPSAWERSGEEPKSSGSPALVNPYPDDEPDFNAEANARARQEHNR